ncbi:hypothetical protein HDV05_007466 [Chytridiales sp. JEL 0842]|nr:hypothetical protein HDV05_007466 [Chytridiales sp. JEL 0842]
MLVKFTSLLIATLLTSTLTSALPHPQEAPQQQELVENKDFTIDTTALFTPHEEPTTTTEEPTSTLTPQLEDMLARKKNCSKACPKTYQPICATDGNTYNNACLLSIKTCEDKRVVMAHRGQCKPTNCDAIRCMDLQDPVCGSDGQTYLNSCLYMVASCRNKFLGAAIKGACAGSPGGKVLQ